MKKPTIALSLSDRLQNSINDLDNAERLAIESAASENAAKLAGLENYLAWQKKHSDVLARRDVLKSQRDDLARQQAEAESQEAEAMRATRYDAAGSERDRVVGAAVSLAENTRREVGALLSRARHIEAEIRRVNADLPNGREPIDELTRDPRLAAGEIIEKRGLYVDRRPVNVFDREFFISEPPAELPVALPPKSTTALPTAAPPQAADLDDGAFRPATIHALPPHVHEAEADTPWKPARIIALPQSTRAV